MLKGLSQKELEAAILLATSVPAKHKSVRTKKTLDRLDRILAAIVRPRTRTIIEMVHRQPQTASEIASAMHLRRSVVSRYLTDLREAGITEEAKSNRDGRERIISIKGGALSDLSAWVGLISTSTKSSER